MEETHYSKVKNMILELGYNISTEYPEDELIIINDPESGISNLAIGVADPLLIMEQILLDIETTDNAFLISLLKKNRDIVHGAFCLNEEGTKLIFRDTLQIENLDLNELEGSINSLALLLTEYADELLKHLPLSK